jgi:tetratricopeptide (TPR) repeat protein
VTWSAVHLELGDLRRAAGDLVRARAAFSPDEPVELTFAEGLVAQKACRVVDAIRAYRATIDSGSDDPIVRFKAANNLGELLTEAGRLDEAEATLAFAADLIEGRSNTFAAATATNRGVVAVHRGDLATAQAHFARAREFATAAEVSLVECQLEEVRAARAVGLWRDAVTQLTALVECFDTPGAALLRADAQILLAEAALHIGAADLARRTSLEARDSLARQRRPADRAAAIVLGARAALAVDGDHPARPASLPHGDPARDVLGAAEAAALRRAAAVLAERGELEWAVTAWLELGRVESLRSRQPAAVAAWRRAASLAADAPVLVRASGHLARALAAPSALAARRACAAGLADLDAHRDGVTSTEQRARLAAQGRSLADLALTTLGPRAPARTLFRWFEAGRSIGQVETEVRTADPAVLDDLAALRRLSSPAAMGGVASEPDARARLVERRRLEARLRRRAWSDAVVPSARRPLDLATLVERLGSAALISYGVVGETLIAVTIARGRARRHTVGPVGPAARLARRLSLAARRLTDGRDAGAMVDRVTQEIAELDRIVVAPLAGSPVLGSASELVVIPPLPLAGLPWGSLPSLRSMPVRIAPSARLWADTASTAVDCSSRVDAALIAGPGLPHAEAEVRQLAARRPRATTLASNAATGAAAARALDGATLAHIACHGKLRTDVPLLSALELADGAFTGYDIEQIARPPLVVVLAACETGVLSAPDDDARADLLGFPSILLQRGTRAVIGATVLVPDLDTSTFMLQVHDHLLAGGTTAGALAAARQATDASSPAGLATSIAFSCFGGG